MTPVLKRFLARRALEHGKSARLWRRLASPSSTEWTEYLKRHGGFRSFGENCYIDAGSIFTDPAYTVIGNNVRIAGAWVSCHDGSVNMINNSYGTRLDAVGPVVFHDNVFVGYGAKILPGVTIGPRALVGAGTVVVKDVPPNSVVVGNPARVIRTLDEHVELMSARMAAYPWRRMFEEHGPQVDTSATSELRKMRTAHFFGEKDGDTGAARPTVPRADRSGGSDYDGRLRA